MVAEWLIPVPVRRVLAAIQCEKNLFRQGIATERGPRIAPRRYRQKPRCHFDQMTVRGLAGEPCRLGGTVAAQRNDIRCELKWAKGPYPFLIRGRNGDRYR
jgi:hypothetical protein